MKKSLWARLELPLETTKENIWSALTLPELTKHYMYNCQLHCSWELGSEALWQEVQKDGSFHTHLSGTLLEYKPYSLLRFILSPSQKGVLLTVEQGDFSTFPQAEEIYAECVSGWNYVRDKLRATCLSVK
jgi:uncharacterized protein YndB with AHSA1/START domain